MSVEWVQGSSEENDPDPGSLTDEELVGKMRAYTEENVQIVFEPGRVTAVWIGDEELAKRPHQALRDHRERDDVEIVATGTRYYNGRGGVKFSGWVVVSGHDFSDSIPSKAEMLEHMRLAVASRMSAGRRCPRVV